MQAISNVHVGCRFPTPTLTNWQNTIKCSKIFTLVINVGEQFNNTNIISKTNNLNKNCDLDML